MTYIKTLEKPIIGIIKQKNWVKKSTNYNHIISQSQSFIDKIRIKLAQIILHLYFLQGPKNKVYYLTANKKLTTYLLL